MATLTANQARQKAASLKLNPNDYGIASWSNADYQTLANALNVNIGGANNINKILAYPGGSTDPVTNQILNQQQTQQAAASYTKENAIAEIKKLASDYVDTAWNSSSYTQKGMDVFKANFESKIKALFEKTKNYVNPNEFNSIFSQSANDRNTFQVNAFKENNKSSGGLLGFVEKAAPIITNIGAGIITGGLSLTQQLAANALIGLAKGGSPEDIVRGIIGSVAADQIPGVLKDINQQISSAAPQLFDPTVKAALINAERQAVNALATKQDVGTAALAGVAGGAVSDVGLLATDNAAIARAAGEYTQALASGMSQTDALNRALAGFVSAEQAAAKQKVLDAAAQDQTKTSDQTVTTDQTTQTQTPVSGNATVTSSQENISSLPPVTVTATADPNKAILDLISPTTQVTTPKIKTPSLPEVTVTATADNTAGNLSTISSSDTGTKEQAKTTTPTRDSILLSLLNQPMNAQYLGSQTTTTPTQTQLTYGPGSQALAQALRIGDAGAPIFGGDKEKSKRSGWNVESLRYMGNSEV